MSLIAVHLHWGEPFSDGCCSGLSGPELDETIHRDLPGGEPLPEGCCARQVRRHGRTWSDTQLWWSEDEARRFLRQLAERWPSGSLAPPSRTAVLPLPDALGATYLRTGRFPAFLPARAGLPTEDLLMMAGPALAGAAGA